MDEQVKINSITKRFKVLGKVPESERLKIFKRAKFHPLHWGVLILLFCIWFYVFGWEIIEMSGNVIGNEKGRSSRYAAILRKLFFPAILPSILIILTSWRLQGYLIKKIVRNEYNKESNRTNVETVDNTEDLDEIIIKEIEVSDFGGATPELTLRKSGDGYLIVEMPPFNDGDGNEIDGDEDFPEVLEFENLISEYIGHKVEREDREVFIIPNATEESLKKTKYFMENYWELRKDNYKKN